MKILSKLTKKLTSFYNKVSGQFKKTQVDSSSINEKNITLHFMNEKDLKIYRLIRKELINRKTPIDIVHLSMNLDLSISDFLPILKEMSRNDEFINGDNFEIIQIK